MAQTLPTAKSVEESAKAHIAMVVTELEKLHDAIYTMQNNEIGLYFRLQESGHLQGFDAEDFRNQYLKLTDPIRAGIVRLVTDSKLDDAGMEGIPV